MWSIVLKLVSPVIGVVKPYIGKIAVVSIIMLTAASASLAYLYVNSLESSAELRREVEHYDRRINELELSIQKERAKHAAIQDERSASKSEFSTTKARIDAKKTAAAKAEASDNVVVFRDTIQAEFDGVINSIKCLSQGASC